jgi:hypothetical protein
MLQIKPVRLPRIKTSLCVHSACYTDDRHPKFKDTIRMCYNIFFKCALCLTYSILTCAYSRSLADTNVHWPSHRYLLWVHISLLGIFFREPRAGVRRGDSGGESFAVCRQSVQLWCDQQMRLCRTDAIRSSCRHHRQPLRSRITNNAAGTIVFDAANHFAVCAAVNNARQRTRSR